MELSNVKFVVRLSAEQAGPFPVATEALWCEKKEKAYQIKNIPFFVDGVSFDDIVSFQEIDNGTFTIETVIERSKNSTIWLYAKSAQDGKDFISQLLALGCGVESGVISDFYAINVPAAVDIAPIYEVLDSAKERGLIEVDYPSVRHDEVS